MATWHSARHELVVVAWGKNETPTQRDRHLEAAAQRGRRA